ncbi:MAG TPA: ChbG/HpnK family deacetylase, partial [Pyrinomonadaceae bacterium]|nr:ChbG/HpnK family deacetylase [Pyrinomonadaceae bacterium]
HLTLTSEFETHRWRPVNNTDAATGLTDDEGCFHRTAADLAEHAAPDAARDEMRAQVERALQAGVDVTHLDTHMFTAFMPQFLPHYVELGREFQLPALLLRFDDPACGLSARAHDSQPEAWARAAQIVRDAEAQGAPVFDRLAKMPLDRPEDRLTQAKMIFDAAPAGLTHFLIHPATDAPELRAVTRDWPSRVADYETFTSAELRRHVKDSGVQLVGYRALRDALRRSNRETTVSLRGTDAWTSKSSAAMN